MSTATPYEHPQSHRAAVTAESKKTCTYYTSLTLASEHVYLLKDRQIGIFSYENCASLMSTLNVVSEAIRACHRISLLGSSTKFRVIY
jgi:hypothetical protein